MIPGIVTIVDTLGIGSGEVQTKVFTDCSAQIKQQHHHSHLRALFPPYGARLNLETRLPRKTQAVMFWDLLVVLNRL